MADRSEVSVYLLPTLIPEGALTEGVAVVVDVLRATTSMVHALAAGCHAVIPCGEIDEARRRASEFPAGTALLVGERNGLPIEGFDLGNSPDAFTPEVCAGKTVVMTTTNGTRAILASREARRVIVAAFVNLRSTVKLLAEDGGPVYVVCSGTDGRISLEDALLAGALVESLEDLGWAVANDEAEMAATLWYDTDYRIAEEGDPLTNFLAVGRGGKRVVELGFNADLDAAARIDHFDLTAELQIDPFRVIRVGSPE